MASSSNPTTDASTSQFVKATAIKCKVNQIEYAPNNLLANLKPIINPQYYGNMIYFLKGCLISQRFTRDVPLYLNYQQEFRYTPNVDGNEIKATIQNGTRNILVNLEIFRFACGFDYFNSDEEPEEVASINEAKLIFDTIEYKCKTGQSAAHISTFKKSCMSRRWVYFFSHIISSIGGNTGSKDQTNSWQQRFSHALLTGRKVDYAKLVFEDFKKKIAQDSRLNHPL